jgi:hypothetical protein
VQWAARMKGVAASARAAGAVAGRESAGAGLAGGETVQTAGMATQG